MKHEPKPEKEPLMMLSRKPDNKHPYTMRIERQIVDKLGLKLYDKIPAVVAELIANAYDADAEKVTVELPLGKALAVKKGDKIVEKGYVIEVHDDGHGMTPFEANEFYLRVGKDRRVDPKQGDKSRKKGRPVMGRKGIGKLAPFGVCRTIEVRSAGGVKTSKGFQVTHFELDYDKIVGKTSEKDNEYFPAPLRDDGTWDKKSGTIVRLRNFLPKVVPDMETFHRQLSYRFGLTLPDFQIFVKDTKEVNPEKEFSVGSQKPPIMPGTELVVDGLPVKTEDGQSFPVRGWIAMAKESYRNIEFAGVRIYVRGKVASVTRDFGLTPGFTGEYVARSYLVGEIHADWLDETEDLIQTHRQDILWESDVGQAFAKWGQELLRKVARLGREPRRRKLSEEFLRVSKLAELARNRFKDEELVSTAVQIGEKIGGFASEEELKDEEYVEALAEIVLMFTPHKLLADTFKKIQDMAVDGKIDLQDLIKLFRTSNIAQLASYGHIVYEKLKAIDAFEQAIRKIEIEEFDLQQMLESAPWLIDTKWEILTANQSFKSFRDAFENWYKRHYKEEILTTSSDANQKKRPDFIFIHANDGLKIVEIKPPKHDFGDADWERLNRYHDALQDFFEKNKQFKKLFPNDFIIVLITDGVNMSNSSNKKAMELLKGRGVLRTQTWEEILQDTKSHHKDFLEARSRQLN